MGKVVLENVTKKFGNVIAVNNANLEIRDKEFLILVGPSGCGKSTTLRMVAGLEDISSGNIYIDDKIVNDVPPKDRDIAMVFQNYALYPHMDVFNNMAFGLKLRKFPKLEIERRVKEAAKLLGIENLMERKPKELSGGQKQRVAVGRAIVREPKVFLMDEPLSNLDAKLRVQMRSELTKLHNRLQTTMIYVTHDQTEAMTMGDRIVVMKDGFILQVGAPLEIYNHPDSVFVATFIGSPAMNVVEAILTKDGDSYWVENMERTFRLKIPKERENYFENLEDYVDREILFESALKDIDDFEDRGEESEDYSFTAMVDVLEPMGAETFLYLSFGDELEFVARVDSTSRAKALEQHKVIVNMSKCQLFDKDTESPRKKGRIFRD